MRLLALLAMLPLAARAELIYVDYDGVVTSIANIDFYPDRPYRVGQRVEGRLTIDTVLAGTPRFDTDNNILDYGADTADGTFAENFVTGYLGDGPGVTTDAVRFVNDHGGGALDTFNAADDAYYFRSVALSVSASVRGLFDDGFGFDHVIDLKASDLGPRDSMFVTIIDNVERYTHVALDRLTVKPARCFAQT